MSYSLQNGFPGGKAYGLDMTDAILLWPARTNKKLAYNVEFLKGEMRKFHFPTIRWMSFFKLCD